MTTIALVQTRITSVEENAQRILRYLDQAIQNEADIVVFPEFALQYYTEKSKQLTYEMLLPYFEEIGNKCKKGSIYALVPAVIKQGEELFNRSFLLNRKGEIEYVYTKQCLFWKEKELAKASSGTTNRVLKTDFGTIGILQCYDIYSPTRLTLARPLADEGAEILFVPSDSVHYDYPGKENKEDVENAPVILAKELGVYVAVCDTYRPKPENAYPSDLDNEYSLCYSRVVDPRGEVISSIQNEEGILFAPIDNIRGVPKK